MKQILLLILFVLASIFSRGQSLVPTPFTYTSCAASTPPNGWTNCRVNVDCAASRCTPPAGYTGQAVMSFGESFSYALATPLTVGQSYTISMKVCVGLLGSSTIISGNHSFMVVGTTAPPSNCGGAYGSICSTPGGITLLSGTQNNLSWQTFTTTFTATAAIQYITIGNCDNTGNGGNLFSNFSLIPDGITLTSGTGSDNQSVCPNTAINNITYTTPSATGATVSNLPAGVSSSFNNNVVTISGTPATPGTYNYTLTLTGGANNGLSTTGNIIVKPVPIATASPSPQTICSGTASSIALTSTVSGTTYAWTAPVMSGVSGGTAGSGSTIAQTLTATGTNPGTAIYTITPTANNCVGAAITDTVTVTPLPAATASPSPQTICSGTASSIALTSTVSGTTYTWTAPVMSGVSGGTAGSGSAIAQTLTATGTNPGTAIYTITPSANGCTGAPIKDTVFVKPLPVVTNNPLSQSICTGAMATVNLQSNLTGTSFNWTANATNVTGAANGSGNTISQSLSTATNMPGTVVYSITPSLNACTGPTANYTVTVNPKSTGTQTTTICQGQSYTFNGIAYTSSNNTAKDTLMNQYGCDSVVTLNLTVIPAITNTINPVICQGNSYPFGGTNYTSSQTGIIHTFHTTSGCDSIVTMNLTVNPPLTGTQITTICQGQSYTFNGIVYTTSNSTAKDTLQNALGCDSIVTLNLTVTPAITNTINPVICQGNSYNFGGTNYTSSQTGIVHTFHTISGCDSIVTMNLTVNPPLTGTQTTTICQGQSYTFNGIVYTTSNSTAKDTLQNALGCDSIVTLNLTVTPAITNTINPVICQGNSYPFGGTNYTSSQTGIVHTFHTTSGCDSIVTMNLTVNPPLTGTQTTTICQGQSYTFNGIVYTTSNSTAKDTLQNTLGCDSVVTLNLTVSPPLTNTINPVICQGNSYNFGGTVYTTSQSGIVHNFPTAQGCDSLVTMNLTVSPPLTNTINPVICQGNSYNFGGTVYTTSQSGIVHNFPTAQGCDSIVTMNLTVNPVTTGTQTTVLCQGQSFTFNGITYTSSNYTAKDTLVNQYGCDSIVTLNLTVNPVTSGTQTVTICQGHSYSFNGITYTAGNTTATDTLVNQYGCDSIVTLNLTVTPAPTTTLNDTICLGASYTFGPHVFTTDQSGFVHNFPTAQGCDSLVTLNLTVLNIVPQPLNITESGCDVVSFEGTDYTSSTIINDTLYSDFGCDSIYRHIEITVHKTVAYELDIDTAGCDEVFVNGVRYTSDAQVRDTLKNQYGCDSVYRDFHIKIYQFQLDLSFTPDDPYQMERIEFTTSSYYGNNYKVLSWSPATAFSDQDAKSQTASFTAPTQVIVRARSLDGGCEDEFRVNIDPREYSKEVAVPNAFSPNGDGLNDIFRPVLKLERAYNTMDFRIYNRYGQLVHATANMNHGWDGMFNGRPADNGVYSYKLVIYFLDGTNKVFTGEVSLLR